MKKLNMLLMGMVAVAMASCDEPAPTVPPVQINPQGPVFATSDVHGAVEGPIAAGSINLEAYRDADAIDVYRLDSINNVAADATVSLQLQLSDTETFDKTQTIDTDCDNGLYTVTPDALDEAHTNFYGKLYLEKDIYYRILGFVTVDGSTFRIGGTDYYLASGMYKSYPFERAAVEYLYTPGSSNGWSPATSQALFTYNYVDYMGFANLSGDFKLTTEPSWDGTNYGDGGDGILTADGGAGNLHAGDNGLYWITANLETLHYNIYAVHTLGIVGDATDLGWDGSTPLSHDDHFLKWSGVVNFKGDGGWKFRANDEWEVNLGIDDGRLTQNGGNIPTPGEGTYLLTLDLSKLPYSYTAVKQ